MTIEEAKERVQLMVDMGVITVTEGERRMNDPNLIENVEREMRREKEMKERNRQILAELEAKRSELVSKKRKTIKVGDLVKLDPLFIETDTIGLVTEIRRTSEVNFLYIKWTGKEPEHYEISDRLGTKEYYFIKL